MHWSRRSWFCSISFATNCKTKAFVLIFSDEKMKLCPKKKKVDEEEESWWKVDQLFRIWSVVSVFAVRDTGAASVVPQHWTGPWAFPFSSFPHAIPSEYSGTHSRFEVLQACPGDLWRDGGSGDVKGSIGVGVTGFTSERTKETNLIVALWKEKEKLNAIKTSKHFILEHSSGPSESESDSP